MAKYLNNITKYLFVALFSLSSGFGYAQTLSSRAQISVLTFGPGTDELYAGFGHSAIRVYDPANRFDYAYNYGTFDFNQPNFYLNFAKGYMIYKLAVQDYRRLKEYYKYKNRSITEQVLSLTPAQKQKVFDYLQNNAQPENAGYYYDYFYDNCATKIGDVFVEALGNEFRFNENFVEEPGLTIRTLTDRYSAEQFPWGKLGIDLCLGMPMDKQLTNMQYTFLPDYVFKAFSLAEVKINGEWHPAVAKVNEVFVASPSETSTPWLTPVTVFGALMVIILVLSVQSLKSGFSLRWLDFTLFLTMGVLGVFFLLLWLATNHAAAAWNLNLLWAWPTHLVIAFIFLKKHRPRWFNWYLLFTAGLGILLVLTWSVLPQALNTGLIPVTLILVIRAVGNILD